MIIFSYIIFMTNLTLHEDNKIQWFEFNLLKEQKKLSHAFFSRSGGVSEAPFNSLNVSFASGDKAENVVENQERIKNCLEKTHGKPFSILRPKLDHGTVIAEISPHTAHWPSCDVMVTKCANMALMITHADCQACILYDPVQHVVANVHSGWRGNVQNIYQKTVEYLVDKHGCKAENILACVGPSLGPESGQFINYKTELPQSFLDFQIKPFYFDFWAITRWQLKSAGLLNHHVECAEIDTVKDERFFSYRRDKISGRNAALVVLK